MTARITKMAQTVKIGLPGSPCTIVNTQMHDELTALNFMSGQQIVGHIISEDQNYVTFKNFLTDQVKRHNHNVIASIEPTVSVYELTVDLSTHSHFNKQFKTQQMHNTSYFTIYTHQTVKQVNDYTKNDVKTLASQDNYF